MEETETEIDCGRDKKRIERRKKNVWKTWTDREKDDAIVANWFTRFGSSPSMVAVMGLRLHNPHLYPPLARAVMSLRLHMHFHHLHVLS